MITWSKYEKVCAPWQLSLKTWTSSHELARSWLLGCLDDPNRARNWSMHNGLLLNMSGGSVSCFSTLANLTDAYAKLAALRTWSFAIFWSGASSKTK